MPINTLFPAATTVAHINRVPAWWKTDDNFVYIGRGSKWGNPYRIGKDGNREEVIDKFREYILRGEGRHLLHNLHEVRGKTCVCYCHPQPCHGDVIASLADN